MKYVGWKWNLIYTNKYNDNWLSDGGSDEGEGPTDNDNDEDDDGGGGEYGCYFEDNS